MQDDAELNPAKVPHEKQRTGTQWQLDFGPAPRSYQPAHAAPVYPSRGGKFGDEAGVITNSDNYFFIKN